jgi:hypothetical protein
MNTGDKQVLLFEVAFHILRIGLSVFTKLAMPVFEGKASPPV